MKMRKNAFRHLKNTTYLDYTGAGVYMDRAIKEYNDDLVVALEVISMIKLAKLIVKSALLRKESRGAHYRIDYPERNNDEYLKSFILNKNSDVKTIKRGLFD